MTDQINDPEAKAASQVAFAVGLLLTKLVPVVKAKVPSFKHSKLHPFEDCCKTLMKNADVFFPNPEVRESAMILLRRASFIPERVASMVGIFYVLKQCF